MISDKNAQLKFVPVLAFVSVLLMSVCISCEDDDETTDLVGNWIERSDYEGVGRCDAVSFTIGDKAYVGTGYDGSDRLKDIWEYDSERNTWIQKASLPGVARNGAVAFSDDNYGYVGLGYDGINKLKDFWKFDPEANEWEQISDFGGSARYGAIAVSLNNKGYVGAGYDGNYLKDFWEYDSENDTWVQKVSIGGSKRKDAIAFAINGKAYVGTGVDNGVYEDDFWEYDPDTDMWTEKNQISDATDEDFDDDYIGITGLSKVGFSLNGKGYISTSGEGVTGVNVWEYDPDSDVWTQKTSLEGSARTEAVAFVVNDRAYITTGRSSSYYFDDIWEFFPDDEYDEYDK